MAKISFKIGEPIPRIHHFNIGDRIDTKVLTYFRANYYIIFENGLHERYKWHNSFNHHIVDRIEEINGEICYVGDEHGSKSTYLKASEIDKFFI